VPEGWKILQLDGGGYEEPQKLLETQNLLKTLLRAVRPGEVTAVPTSVTSSQLRDNTTAEIVAAFVHARGWEPRQKNKYAKRREFLGTIMKSLKQTAVDLGFVTFTFAQGSIAHALGQLQFAITNPGNRFAVTFFEPRDTQQSPAIE